MKSLILFLIRKFGKHYKGIFGPMLSYEDYFKFPFDCNQPLNKEKGSEVLREGCHLLDTLNFPYVLATGTALGIYREGNFIQNDTDLDVDLIATDISEKQLNILASRFITLGFTMGRRVTYRRKTQQVVFFNKDEVIFDMCLWRKKGDFYYNYLPELGLKVRKHPSRFYDVIDTLVFNDVKYSIPKDIEDWLAYQYGGDWRTPKAKSNWVEESIDLDTNKNRSFRLYSKVEGFINKF